jgi:hypothetical protein
MSARLFSFRFFVGAVRLCMSRLLSRLRNVFRPLGKVLSLLLLFVNDFLIVSYVSWIGHTAVYLRSWQ